MFRLFWAGTILDNCTDHVNSLLGTVPWLVVLFFTYILISNFTIFNMLIGCLCEVVSNVKEIEEEKAMIFDTNENLKTVTDQMKKAGDGAEVEMTLEVFREIVLNDEVKKALEDIGVEEKHFECLASILFTNPEKADEFR